MPTTTAAEVALPVLHTMTAELSRGGLSLPDMADIAHLSPYHFIRVFRMATGLPPGAFQAALRLQEAKRRLRDTDAPVTDICFELGYRSLGSFVARFTASVGLSPARYRLACRQPPPADPVLARLLGSPPPGGPHTVSGDLVAGPGAVGPAFIGLFPRYLPSGLPLAGTPRWGSGPFAVGPVADGTYALLAAACPPGPALAEALIHDRGLLVAGAAPVQVAAGRCGPVRLVLRPHAPTDPPVLLALPLLLARAVARATAILEKRAGPVLG